MKNNNEQFQQWNGKLNRNINWNRLILENAWNKCCFFASLFVRRVSPFYYQHWNSQLNIVWKMPKKAPQFEGWTNTHRHGKRDRQRVEFHAAWIISGNIFKWVCNYMEWLVSFDRSIDQKRTKCDLYRALRAINVILQAWGKKSWTQN